MKHIGFLSFGHWTPSPHSQTRSASDALLQSIELAVAAEELGADGAYFRVHHFARQLGSPFPLLAAVGARTKRIEIGTAVIDMRYENPMYMAEDAGAADLIAGGRLQLGISRGSPEQVIEELYVRTLCRKPTPAETKRLAAIVRRETGDPERVKALAVLQARVDTGYRRGEERLQQLREDLKKAPNNSREAAALNRQIANVEQQLDGLRKSYERNVPQMVYGDILWGLFNSTEFTFNH